MLICYGGGGRGARAGYFACRVAEARAQAQASARARRLGSTEWFCSLCILSSGSVRVGRFGDLKTTRLCKGALCVAYNQSNWLLAAFGACPLHLAAWVPARALGPALAAHERAAAAAVVAPVEEAELAPTNGARAGCVVAHPRHHARLLHRLRWLLRWHRRRRHRRCVATASASASASAASPDLALARARPTIPSSTSCTRTAIGVDADGRPRAG